MTGESCPLHYFLFWTCDKTVLQDPTDTDKIMLQYNAMLIVTIFAARDHQSYVLLQQTHAQIYMRVSFARGREQRQSPPRFPVEN